MTGQAVHYMTPGIGQVVKVDILGIHCRPGMWSTCFFCETQTPALKNLDSDSGPKIRLQL